MLKHTLFGGVSLIALVISAPAMAACGIPVAGISTITTGQLCVHNQPHDPAVTAVESYPAGYIASGGESLTVTNGAGLVKNGGGNIVSFNNNTLGAVYNQGVIRKGSDAEPDTTAIDLRSSSVGGPSLLTLLNNSGTIQADIGVSLSTPTADGFSQITDFVNSGRIEASKNAVVLNTETAPGS